MQPYTKLNTTEVLKAHRNTYFRLPLAEYVSEIVSQKHAPLFSEIGMWLKRRFSKPELTFWVTASCSQLIVKLGEETVVKLTKTGRMYVNASEDVLGAPVPGSGYINETGCGPAVSQLDYDTPELGFDKYIKARIVLCYDHWLSKLEVPCA